MPLVEIIAAGAAAGQTLQGVFEKLNGSRSVVLEIDNDTGVTLKKIKDHHDNGGFAEAPSIVIPPKKADVFGSQNVGGSLFTGTEGTVTYEGDGFTLEIYWDNPFVGSNECNATLSGSKAVNYRVDKTCGVGNEKAHMRYQLFHVLYNWNRPFPITPPNAAVAGSAVTAVARTPDHIDVFWVGTDGAIGSNWGDGSGTIDLSVFNS